MITAEFTSEIVNLRVSNLFQWDINQVIKIRGLAFGTDPIEVHFCNKKSTSAVVVVSTAPSAGVVYANIPNSLLTQPYDIVAYIYQTEGSTRGTTNTITIPVVKRQKPNDYADSNGGKCSVPVNLVLDEFNNIGKLGGAADGSDFTRFLSVCRSREIRVMLAVQSLGQLQNRYPKNVWAELLGNCDTVLSKFFFKVGNIIVTNIHSVNKHLSLCYVVKSWNKSDK